MRCIVRHDGAAAITFRTVFDAAQNGYAAWWFPAHGQIFVALGAAIAALRDGTAAVVEGPVTSLVDSGHAGENLTVAAHRFAYSDDEVSAGFRHSASHGGPIRVGLYVRVTYVGKLILRLEVGQ